MLHLDICVLHVESLHKNDTIYVQSHKGDTMLYLDP